jgi:hypothetical protein
MNPLLLAPIFDIAGKIFDRVIPDKAAAQKAKDEFAAIGQGQDFQLAMQQIALNMVEAQSPSLFKSGWRPAVGWIGVAALGLSYVPKALVLTGFWCYSAYLTYAAPGAVVAPLPAFPDLGVGDVLALLAAILGVGALRTVEKVKGVA